MCNVYKLHFIYKNINCSSYSDIMKFGQSLLESVIKHTRIEYNLLI